MQAAKTPRSNNPDLPELLVSGRFLKTRRDSEIILSGLWKISEYLKPLGTASMVAEAMGCAASAASTQQVAPEPNLASASRLVGLRDVSAQVFQHATRRILAKHL